MVQRLEGFQLRAADVVADATVAESSTEQLQASGADREPEQEPRLIAPLRLVRTFVAVSIIIILLSLYVYKI